MIEAAIENGINLFDTADCYGGGQSETFLGRALGKRRHDVVISTKFGVPMGEGPFMKGASRRYVLQAAEASLASGHGLHRRLLPAHPRRGDADRRTLDAMNTLVDQGRSATWAARTSPGWQIADASWTRIRPGCAASSRRRTSGACCKGRRGGGRAGLRALGSACCLYFPLASGALTGKYRRGQAFGEDSRYGADKSGMFKAMYGHFVSDESLARVERLEKVAADCGLGLVELALSWLASQPVVSSVIAGATRARADRDERAQHAGRSRARRDGGGRQGPRGASLHRSLGGEPTWACTKDGSRS
ncbi:MAG: aldo/keto reductase [Myxococcota bacterium]